MQFTDPRNFRKIAMQGQLTYESFVESAQSPHTIFAGGKRLLQRLYINRSSVGSESLCFKE